MVILLWEGYPIIGCLSLLCPYRPRNTFYKFNYPFDSLQTDRMDQKSNGLNKIDFSVFIASSTNDIIFSTSS